MIEPVDPFVPAFGAVAGGAGRSGSLMSFHPEASRHPLRTIDLIRKQGCKPGIALDPGTAIETVKHLLPEVDFVLLMTVSPGYAGQKLIPSMLGKIGELRRWLDEAGLSLPIEVDGNVSWENLPAMIRAGGDIFVTGTSSVFERGARLEEGLERLNRLFAAAGAPASAGLVEGSQSAAGRRP
jgi:ribulose-phosphate 3-epimerase